MSDYTRDYYRGRSFNFANEWTKNMHYFNDQYNTDFVSYKGALLVCNISHLSDTTNEPTLLYADPTNPKIPTGVKSEYWDFVTGGTPGPRGGVIVPKYNQDTGMLSWTLVDGDDVEIPSESYIKGKDGITPKFRVNSSTGYWEVSYDNGVSYTSTNTKAQGEKGDPLRYEDLTSSQIAELQKPAKEAAKEVETLTNKTELLLENLKGAAADATRAAGKAESAANESNKAIAAANTALANANSAIDRAENATNKVNSAIKSIDAAVEKANNATSAANSAASNAEQWSHDVREAIGKCIMATDKADTAARKVFALLGLVDASLKNANSAEEAAKKALENANKAEETLNSVISNAEKATNEANEATSQLKDALKNVNDAVENANQFIEDATQQINDLKESAEEAINDLTEESKKMIQKVVDEATETINTLKEETEAALQEAQAKLEELYTKIETFIDEQTEELHRLHGDVEVAIAGANKATNAANEATIETLKHLTECKEQCELTKQERERASAAADRAEEAAQNAENFVEEYQPQLDKTIKHVKTLVGDDKNKSVRTIANEELVKQLIPENASEALDTLEEIAAWIQSHPENASAMNAAIEELKTKMSLGEQMINDEISRSTTKDEELEAQINGLESVTATLSSSIDQNKSSIEQLAADLEASKITAESTDTVETEILEGRILRSKLKINNEGGNALKYDNNGAYVHISLSYDEDKNKLTFNDGNGDREITLTGASVIKNGHYESSTRELVFILANGTELRVPVGDLFNQLKAINPDNDPVNLIINHNADGQDTIQANLNISESPDNLILKNNGTLFASKQAKDHYVSFGGQEEIDVQTAINRVKETADNSKTVSESVKDQLEIINKLIEDQDKTYVRKDASNMNELEKPVFIDALGISSVEDEDINALFQE